MDWATEQLNVQNIIVSKDTESNSDENSPPDFSNEKLKSLMTEFKSYKPNYLELQAKLNFVVELVQKEPQEMAASVADPAIVEADAREKRLALMEKKKKCSEHEARILKTLNRMIQANSKLKTLQQTQTEKSEKLKDLSNQWKDAQVKNAERRDKLQGMLSTALSTAADIDECIERQLDFMMQSVNKIKTLEDSYLELNSQVSALESTVIEKTAAAEQRKVGNKKNRERVKELGKMENIINWYDTMHKLNQSISGLEVVKTSETYDEFKILSSHTLVHEKRENTFKLDPPDICISDIINAEKTDKRQRIKFVLSTVRDRVMNKNLMEKHIVELNKRFELESLNEGEVTIFAVTTNHPEAHYEAILKIKSAEYSKKSLSVFQVNDVGRGNKSLTQSQLNNLCSKVESSLKSRNDRVSLLSYVPALVDALVAENK